MVIAEFYRPTDGSGKANAPTFCAVLWDEKTLP
jgi:hypothetical protein